MNPRFFLLLKLALKFLLYLLAFIIVAYFIFSLVVRPSLNRDWTKDEQVLARATFDGNLIKITNIRNIEYRSTTDYDVHMYDKTFDLSKLNSVWYMVEPFTGHGAGAAHTLVSFGFEDGSYVAISVEIRKEKGESFGAVKGLLRQYELVYIIADEKDVIKLRSNYRKDQVFLYPVKTTKENMRKLFVSMLERANKLATEPEFYNILTSTCTTNIVSHVNEIVPDRVPFSFKVLMPAYSDELAYKIGLFETTAPDGHTMTLEELRAKYKINERAEKYADDPEWSKRIRE
jgi:hypothetical protein